MAGESNQTFQWVARIALIVIALLSLPIGLGCLAGAVAEAFYGNKEPIWIIGGALLAGLMICLVIGSSWLVMISRGDLRLAHRSSIWTLICGFSMWLVAFVLIRAAYLFPDHRIPL